ncbi:MAG: hypothetical protein GY737_01815 [Desulfobacteraceae bacterium]|nr:hypothetical protein [Desulfobacteraceae bacterium]
MRRRAGCLGFFAGALLLLVSVAPVRAAVLHLFDYTIDEFVVGEKRAELAVCYAGGNKYSDKRTTYTGSFLKKWFGGEKTTRETANVLLDQDLIREIDYLKHRVIDYPLDKIVDPDWYDRHSPGEIPSTARTMIDARYEVKAPQFSLTVSPESVMVDNRSCVHAIAELRLETLDKIKNASSVTLIRQAMWLTDQVRGINEFRAFNRAMEKRLGIDAARVGIFGNILSYWQGGLDSIEGLLNSVSGYPVKKEVRVTAVYTSGVGTGDAKRTEAVISKISVNLREVAEAPPGMERFDPPKGFKLVTAR